MYQLRDLEILKVFVNPFRNRKKQFEDLTYPLSNDLFRLALWRLGNRQDAEDALQETYLRAYRSFHTFQPGTNLKGWMIKIVLNVVNDSLKKRLKQPELVTLDDDDGQLETLQSDSHWSQDPLIQLSENEIDPTLLAALGRLPSSLLIPLLLRELEGMSYDDIAKTLDVPSGTVMSRLFRARRAVRESLRQSHTDLIKMRKEVEDDAMQ